MRRKNGREDFSVHSLLIQRYIVIFLLIYIFNPAEILYAQNSDDLESEYERLSGLLNLQNLHLDTLKMQLEVQADRIDQEKERDPVKEEYIRSILAQSVIIADKIDKQQDLIAQTNKKLSAVRDDLLTCYEKDLDSLHRVARESAANYQAGELQSKILQISQKRLLLQPDPPALSFDPRKIITLNVESAPDENTRKLYRELLDSALQEVYHQRNRIGEILRETETLNDLRSRAQQFIERSDLASGPPGGAAAARQNEFRENTAPVVTFDGLKSLALPHVDAYVYIWHQLDYLPTARKTEWISPVDSARIYSSPQEFFTLLTDLDTRLSEYENVLKQMLKSLY